MRKTFDNLVWLTWAFYMASLSTSLAAMEIFSSLLLVLGFVQTGLNAGRFSFSISSPVKIVFVALGLIVVSWAISIWMNQTGSVNLHTDVEAIRRLFFLFLPWVVFRTHFSLSRKAMVFGIVAGILISIPLGFWYRTLENGFRFRGGFSFSSTYGSVLSTLAFPFLWATWSLNRSLCIAGLALIGAGVLASQTRSAWLGSAISVSIILAMAPIASKIKKQTVAICFVCGLAVLLIPTTRERILGSFSDQSFSERKHLAQGGIQIAKTYFPWGTGYKNTARNMPGALAGIGIPANQSHSHNHWIEALAGTGLLSLVGWVLLFGVCFVSAFRTWKRELSVEAAACFAGLCHLFVLSFFDVIFQDGEMSNASFLVVGLVVYQMLLGKSLVSANA